jgi:hypothetical protein
MARAKISATPGRTRTVASKNFFIIASSYQGMAGRPASTRAARARPATTVHQSSESPDFFSFECAVALRGFLSFIGSSL